MSTTFPRMSSQINQEYVHLITLQNIRIGHVNSSATPAARSHTPKNILDDILLRFGCYKLGHNMMIKGFLMTRMVCTISMHWKPQTINYPQITFSSGQLGPPVRDLYKCVRDCTRKFQMNTAGCCYKQGHNMMIKDLLITRMICTLSMYQKLQHMKTSNSYKDQHSRH